MKHPPEKKFFQGAASKFSVKRKTQVNKRKLLSIPLIEEVEAYVQRIKARQGKTSCS